MTKTYTDDKPLLWVHETLKQFDLAKHSDDFFLWRYFISCKKVSILV